MTKESVKHKIMIMKYIFFIEEEKAQVFYYHDGEFVQETEQGETRITTNNQFWDWWKNSSSYVSSNQVDFCFIYDHECTILKEDYLIDFHFVNKSSWSERQIEAFFETQIAYTHIKLISPSGKVMQLDKNNKILGENQQRSYFLSIFQVEEFEENQKEISETTGSSFSEYFREKLRQEAKR